MIENYQVDEESTRCRVVQEEEIFRGSLLYRMQCAMAEIAAIVHIEDSEVQTSSSPMKSQVVRETMSSPVEVMNSFHINSVVEERVIEMETPTGSITKVNEHATVDNNIDTVMRKCRFTCGWSESKTDYVGQTGLVCDVTEEGTALLLFNNGRHQWFPTSVLHTPTLEAAQDAPQVRSKAPPVSLRLPLWKSWIYSILPGGSDADFATIFTYVGLPFILISSIFYLMYYRQHAT